MKIEARYIVAAILLAFAWKGNEITMSWPPAPFENVSPPKPKDEYRAWADDVRAIVPKMMPTDRVYLSNFYDSLAFILLRDKDRKDDRIIKSNEDFAVFHAGSLKAAIDKKKVGIYPGLDKAIDKTFFAAVGTDDPRRLTDAEYDAIIVACGVLSHEFGIGRDG